MPRTIFVKAPRSTLLLLAAGLAAPLIGISQAPVWGWTGFRTLVLLAIRLPLARRLRWTRAASSRPVVAHADVMLPQVRLSNLARLLIGFGLFGASAIISQFVQVFEHDGFGFGASATQAGVFLVPGLVLLLLLAPVAGRLNARAGPKAALVLGSTIGCVALTALVAFHDHEFEMYVWPTLMYVSVAFAFGAAPLLILEAVPAAMRGQSLRSTSSCATSAPRSGCN